MSSPEKGQEYQAVRIFGKDTRKVFSNLLFSLNGAPGRIRTSDRLVRSFNYDF